MFKQTKHTLYKKYRQQRRWTISKMTFIEWMK